MRGRDESQSISRSIRTMYTNAYAKSNNCHTPLFRLFNNACQEHFGKIVHQAACFGKRQHRLWTEQTHV